MKFTSDKASLQQALQQLSKVTPTRSTLSILGSVLISTEDERLSIRATDLEISQVIYIPSKTEGAGSIAIQHRTLLEITNEISEGEMEIEVSEEGKVNITTTTGTYSIMGKPVDEFPSLPEIDDQQTVQIAAPILKRIIDKTAFAVSRDELKPSLLGVLFQFQEEGLRAVATDGHRLVKHIRTDYGDGGYRGDNIIPVKFLNILHSYLDTDETITLNISDNHIMMDSKETALFTRIIDERFPDYDSVFPTDNDKKMTISRGDFVAAVKRVSIFSNKTTHQIALRISEEALEVTTEDVETVSSGREKLECKYEGEDLLIGYNSNYLRDILNHVDSDEIIMEFRSPVSAAVVFPVEQQENEELTLLLMPIRLND
jgi:DNA polymerase-3 subunit beta